MRAGKELRNAQGKQLGEEVTLMLDAQHLRKLVGQASLEAAESFTADYMARLPRFVGRIVRTVVARNRDLALDASLNIKTKS
jgi:hypothetical protein